MPDRDVDKELEPYVIEYYSLLERRCPSKKLGSYPSGNYTIKFGEGDNWIGLCQWKYNGYEITIDKHWWYNESTYNSRSHLMIHELSHCVIEKKHVDNPDHYMYPSITYVPSLVVQAQLQEDMEAFCND